MSQIIPKPERIVDNETFEKEMLRLRRDICHWLSVMNGTLEEISENLEKIANAKSS